MPDIFDEIAGNTGSSDTAISAQEEQPSYLSRFLSSLINTDNLGSDIYNGTIGPLVGLNDALNVAADEAALNPKLPFGLDLPANLIKNFYKDKTLVQGIYDTGKVASGVIPVVGPTLYDKLQQVVNPSVIPPTTPEEDARAVRTNAIGTIALLGAAKAASTLENIPALANSLDRKSIGTRASDYGKASETRTIEGPDGLPETYVKSKLDDLLENNKLGTSRNPANVMKTINEATKPINQAIDDLVKDFDKSGTVAAVPDFDNAINYVISGKVPADEIGTYLTKIDDLEKSINKQGKGSLAFLQEQKKVQGDIWDPADSVKSGFHRALYTDLKNSIEKYIPEVAPLNAELSKYMPAVPIVQRALKASENQSALSKLAGIAYTTGGVGLPAAIGTALGGPAGTAIGAGVGLTTKALASPTGQSLVARALRNIGMITDPIADVASNITPSIASAITEAGQEKDNLKSTDSKENVDIDKIIEDLFSTPKTKGDSMDSDMKYEKQPVAMVEQAIDSDPYWKTLYEFESNRNPNAKNPESSASGGFQFIKKTAEDLGLKDPFDLGESFDKVQELDAETAKLTKGDPSLRYAAHYLGGPAFKKWLNGEDLTEKQQKQAKYLEDILLPRFRKMYRKNVGVAQA